MSEARLGPAMSRAEFDVIVPGHGHDFTFDQVRILVVEEIHLSAPAGSNDRAFAGKSFHIGASPAFASRWQNKGVGGGIESRDIRRRQKAGRKQKNGRSIFEPHSHMSLDEISK